MKFLIQKEVLDKFNNLVVGIVLARDINNRGVSQEINELLHIAADKAIGECSQLESPSRHPNIIPWREAYKKFGSDPHDYRCSSEALLRQVIKGNKVGGINKLVDLYNFISLKYIIPVGGEDLDKTKGDILLTFATGDERFVRLGGTENELPLPNEVIYKDNESVLCRRWNWREAEKTKLTEDTRNAVIVIEGLSPMGREIVEIATAELAGLIDKYCGGAVRYEILTKGKEEMVLG